MPIRASSSGYREELLRTEPIDNEINEVLEDLFARTVTLLAKRRGVRGTDAERALIEEAKASIAEARRRIGGFSRRTKGRQGIEAEILELRRQAYEHIKKAEALIQRPNEPAALAAFRGALNDIAAARQKAIAHRLARQDKVQRITAETDDTISLTQQQYMLLGRARIPIGNYAPRNFRTLWQVFRSLDDQERTELDDHLAMRKAVRALDKTTGRVARGEEFDIKEKLDGITRMLNPRRGDIRLETKRTARIYIREAIELYKAGDRKSASEFLKVAASLFRSRIDEIERILDNLEKGHVKVLRAHARQWNGRIRANAEGALAGLEARMWDDVEGWIGKLKNDKAMDEPQFHGLKLLLENTLKAFRNDRSANASYIRYNLELIKRKAWEAGLLASFMADFRTAWVKARLRSDIEDTDFIEESVFTATFKAFARRRNLTRGSPQEEMWWTRCFQPAFISTTIKPASVREAAIDNPAFEAVSDLIVMQEVRNFSCLLEEYKNRKDFQSTYILIKGFVEGAAGREPIRPARSVNYKELSAHQKDLILKALSEDYKLSASQEGILANAAHPFSVRELIRRDITRASSAGKTKKWTEESVIAVIKEATEAELELNQGKIRSEEQRSKELGKELYHAYKAVVLRKGVPTLPDWKTAVERAGETLPVVKKWTEESVIAVIRESAEAGLELNSGKICSEEQGSTELGKKLYNAYKTVIKKGIPTLPDWKTAVERAGYELPIFYETWTEESVIAVIKESQEADPKLNLNYKAIVSDEQHITKLGRGLYHAYEAVVTRKHIPTLPDWKTAVERTGETLPVVKKWTEESVIAVIKEATEAGLDPNRPQSRKQRATGLGKKLYHAYCAVSKWEIDWWALIEKAGYEQHKRGTHRGRTEKSVAASWTQEQDEQLVSIARAVSEEEGGIDDVITASSKDEALSAFTPEDIFARLRALGQKNLVDRRPYGDIFEGFALICIALAPDAPALFSQYYIHNTHKNGFVDVVATDKAGRPMRYYEVKIGNFSDDIQGQIANRTHIFGIPTEMIEVVYLDENEEVRKIAEEAGVEYVDIANHIAAIANESIRKRMHSVHDALKNISRDADIYNENRGRMRKVAILMQNIFLNIEELKDEPEHLQEILDNLDKIIGLLKRDVSHAADIARYRTFDSIERNVSSYMNSLRLSRPFSIAYDPENGRYVEKETLIRYGNGNGKSANGPNGRSHRENSMALLERVASASAANAPAIFGYTLEDMFGEDGEKVRAKVSEIADRIFTGDEIGSDDEIFERYGLKDYEYIVSELMLHAARMKESKMTEFDYSLFISTIRSLEALPLIRSRISFGRWRNTIKCNSTPYTITKEDLRMLRPLLRYLRVRVPSRYYVIRDNLLCAGNDKIRTAQSIMFIASRLRNYKYLTTPTKDTVGSLLEFYFYIAIKYRCYIMGWLDRYEKSGESETVLNEIVSERNFEIVYNEFKIFGLAVLADVFDPKEISAMLEQEPGLDKKAREEEAGGLGAIARGLILAYADKMGPISVSLYVNSKPIIDQQEPVVMDDLLVIYRYVYRMFQIGSYNYRGTDNKDLRMAVSRLAGRYPIFTTTAEDALNKIMDNPFSIAQLVHYQVQTGQLGQGMSLWHEKSRASSSGVVLDEMEAQNREDKATLKSTIDSTLLDEAKLAKGAVLALYDTDLANEETRDAARAAARAGESAVDRYLDDRFINIRGTGKALYEAAQKEVQRLIDAGIPIAAIVTIAGDGTIKEVGEGNLKALIGEGKSKVIRVDTQGNTRYIPIIALYDLALRIAYCPDDYNGILECLKRIGFKPDAGTPQGKEFKLKDVEDLITNGIIEILPKIKPEKMTEAAEAYKAAQAILTSL